MYSADKHGPAEAKAGNSKSRKHGPPSLEPGEAKARKRKKRISFRPTKTTRPFHPDSKAAKRSLEDHIRCGVQITNEALRHHRKKLEDEKTRERRIGILLTSTAEHKKNLEKGRTPKDSPRTTILRDLKKQEVQLLEAFKRGVVEEKEALHKLLGFGFQQKMVGGPAFHRASLEEADLCAIENFVEECMKEFHKKYSVGE